MSIPCSQRILAWHPPASPHPGSLFRSCSFGMSACVTSQKRLPRRLPPWWTFHFSLLLFFKNIAVCNPPPPYQFQMTFHGVGMDIFCNCTFWPLISHPRNLFAIRKNTVSKKQIIKFLLVMQIAITFISENVLDCIVHEDSIIQVMTIGILVTWST